MKIIFWIFLALICYTIVGYKFLLKSMLLFRKNVWQKKEYYPKLSFIVTFFNEQQRIKEKIENCLAIEYPENKIEFIFISDGSDDGSDDIVAQYSDRVYYFRSHFRIGKESCQKLALDRANGEIIVFSDTGVIIDPDSLTTMMMNFSDQRIGAVSSTDKILNEGYGESDYVVYEMDLRKLESQVNSVVGLSGSFFAVRKEICDNWKSSIQDSDFHLLLNAIRKGYVGIVDDNVRGYYYRLNNDRNEFHRRCRTVLRGITTFFYNLDMLNVFKYGFFSVQLISHKLFRWLIPFWIGGMYVSLFFIINESEIYRIIFSLFSVLLGCTGVGFIFKRLRRFQFFRLLYYQGLSHIAILSSWLTFLLGKRIKIWQPGQG